jgi:hypothetical protein
MNEFFARMQFAQINVSAVANNLIVPAVAGKKIRLMNYKVSADGFVRMTWKSGTTAISGPGLDVGDCQPTCSESVLGVMETATNQPLNLALDSVVQVSGHVGYILVD